MTTDQWLIVGTGFILTLLAGIWLGYAGPGRRALKGLKDHEYLEMMGSRRSMFMPLLVVLPAILLPLTTYASFPKDSLVCCLLRLHQWYISWV